MRLLTHSLLGARPMMEARSRCFSSYPRELVSPLRPSCRSRPTAVAGGNAFLSSNLEASFGMKNSLLSSEVKVRTFSSDKQSLAQLVKQLRASTGAPMMECKKALSAEGVRGNLEKAADWLRQHGTAKASSKVSGRDATEGLVGLKIGEDGKKAALVKVASETDFASRSEVFAKLVEDVADAAIALRSSDGETTEVVDVEGHLLDSTPKDGDKSVKDLMNDAVLSIRENLQISSATVASAGPNAILAGYVHGRAPNSICAGSAAALVEVVSKTANAEVLKDEGKKLAMHIVAAKPLYLRPDTVPDDVVAKEKAILAEQMADSSKPANIVEKIVDGRMRKFYEGACLTEQAHMVEEGNPKVSKLLDKLGIEVRMFEATSMQ